MWWSKELSKASVSKEIISALEVREDVPPYRVLPNEDLDFLIVSEQTVVGVEIALGEPGSALSYTSLGRLERASYTLASQYPDRHLFLALLTNLEVSPRSQQVLSQLGIQLFHTAAPRPEALTVADLMLPTRPVPSLS